MHTEFWSRNVLESVHLEDREDRRTTQDGSQGNDCKDERWMEMAQDLHGISGVHP